MHVWRSKSHHKFVLGNMDSERIVTAFVERMRLQRYSANTIKSYTEYLKLFLQAMQHHEKLAYIPIKEIESFIHSKVTKDSISAPPSAY